MLHASLRDYQEAAITHLLSKEAGILQAPTGSGKTVLAASICDRIQTTWLFIVHRGSLRTQTKKAFEALLGETIGEIGGGVKTSSRVTVANWQSLLGAPTGAVQAALQSKGIILDECHTGGAGNLLAILNSLPATRRYGLSATPFGENIDRNSDLLAVFGHRIVEVSLHSLLTTGVLPKPAIRFIRTPCVDIQSEEWQEIYAAGVVDNLERNNLVLRVIRSCRPPGLVLVLLRRHGNALSEQLRSTGLKAHYIEGSTPAREREAKLKALVAGDLDWIVSTPVLDTGIDIPALNTIINVGARKSPIEILQKVGRGMRGAGGTGGGKRAFGFVDFWDTSHAILLRHSERRLATLRETGYDVEGFSKEGSEDDIEIVRERDLSPPPPPQHEWHEGWAVALPMMIIPLAVAIAILYAVYEMISGVADLIAK